MLLSTRSFGRALLALFVLSGFSGLIYQSVWSNYLGLTLGHAAYAQCLVLAIYMGGMAVGAWLVSRSGARWRRLILAYAGVEAAIGLIGLVFHPAFLAYTHLSQDFVLAHLHSESMARAWQWSSSALLIAPQSVLLGMTFPLMSAGFLRVAPREDGEILGGLYFSNSIGAAFGALFCTFVLLPWIGMPGSVQTASVINLLVGAMAALLARGMENRPEIADTAVAPASRDADRGYAYLLLAAFVTGATSFVYEIGWVRLLNQALGTTVHSFELMLSAFILGLAFGGLWVRKRSRRIVDPVASTGRAQVWMGIAALLSLPVFAQSFGWVGWLMGVLPRTDAGYRLFSAGSAAIALLVMFPAAFFAGMTLPLLTMSLLRRGHGESSIGRVYAANTLGAICGVFFMMYALIPAIGIRLAVTVAAVGDLALGLLLLRFMTEALPRRSLALASACGVAALIASLHYGTPDPSAQVAGVFRTGVVTHPDWRIAYLRDGRTATVSVFVEHGAVGVIATNGKPDAGIGIATGAITPDEATMRMAAALPLALHPHPRDIAVIGWGSGLTTHTFLGSPLPRSVTTVEIEPAMYEGARLFGSHVSRAYDDPRSHVRFDDARTYFSTGNRRFDVIFSEPSNPWVSGVASLFTKEFYGFLRGHLNPGGLMVQWVQSYELNDRLLGTMVAALADKFPDIDVYVTNEFDLMFVASASPLPPLNPQALAVEPLQSELRNVGFAGRGDYAVRRIGSRRVLEAFVRCTGMQPHSDFYPLVSLEAPRARFVDESSGLLQSLVTNGMPVLDVLDGRVPPAAGEVTETASGTFTKVHWLGRDIALALKSGETGPLRVRDPEMAGLAQDLWAMRGQASPRMSSWYRAVAAMAAGSLGILPSQDLVGVWTRPAWVDPATPLPPAALATLAAFDAGARRDVAQMRTRAMAALALLRTESSAPDVLREQMLVLAMLGAVGEHRQDQVFVLERTWGAAIPPSLRYGSIRSYLMAWADMPAADVGYVATARASGR